MANWVADVFDGAGTYFNLPEIGLSELFNAGNKTANTGRVGYSLPAAITVGALPGVGAALPIASGVAFDNAIRQVDNKKQTSKDEQTGSSTEQTGQNTGTTINTGYTGGGYAGPSAQDLAMYNQYLNQVGGILDQAKDAYNNQIGNIDSQFNTRTNEFNSSEAQRRADVARQRVQNQQSLLNDRNRIQDSASQGLRGLLSALGAAGAGGSSAALFNIPNAVADVETAQRSGASQNFASNEQGIDTSWANFMNNLKSERDKLRDWRDDAKNQLTAEHDRLRSDVGSIRDDLSARRGDASSLGSQLLNLKSSIPNAIRQAQSYTGNTPVYEAAKLSTYQQDPTGVKVDGGVGNNTSATPFIDNLLSLNDKKKTEDEYNKFLN